MIARIEHFLAQAERTLRIIILPFPELNVADRSRYFLQVYLFLLLFCLHLGVFPAGHESSDQLLVLIENLRHIV